MDSMFAHDEDERDEDQLDREDDGDGDGDCEHTLHSIVDAMSRRGPPAVRAVREFARALDAMALAVMAENEAQFQQAAHHACVAFSAIEEGDDG